MNYTFNQIVNSQKPQCKLYPIYKKVLEDTNFLADTTSFKIRWWYIENKITSNVLCNCGCGKPLKNPIKTKFLQGHSNKDDAIKKIKENSIVEKYGVTNVSQINGVKTKKRATMQKNHGCNTPFDRKFVSAVWKDTLGVDNPSKLESVRQKIRDKSLKLRESDIEKRTVAFLNSFFDNKILQGRLIDIKPLFTKESYKGVDTVYPFECLQCHNVFYSNLDDGKFIKCNYCHPKDSKSHIEKEVLVYCRNFFSGIIENDRSVISPHELDIYIPDKHIAIEINGLYWHTEKCGKNKLYHLSKTERCIDRGVRSIHILEDEWLDKQDICKARLKNIFGKVERRIYARKCVVNEISSSIKNRFLHKYHIQGSDKSNIHLGLFYHNRLISVMTFSKLRHSLGYTSSVDDVWELSRYCSIFHFNVVGGAGKLLKWFETNYSPKTIISYADRRWSNGGLYGKLGFVFDKFTEPNYWYVINNKRHHRFNFQKHLLKDKLVSYNEQLSEKDNMENNGYSRLWDCGHYKFVKRFY